MTVQSHAEFGKNSTVKLACNGMSIPNSIWREPFQSQTKALKARLRLGAEQIRLFWALHDSFVTVPFFFVKDILDAAGVEYPDENTTWEEFHEKAKALSKTPEQVAEDTQAAIDALVLSGLGA